MEFKGEFGLMFTSLLFEHLLHLIFPGCLSFLLFSFYFFFLVIHIPRGATCSPPSETLHHEESYIAITSTDRNA